MLEESRWNSLLFFDNNRHKGERGRKEGRSERKEGGRVQGVRPRWFGETFIPIPCRERPPPVNDPIKFRAIVIRMGQVVLHK